MNRFDTKWKDINGKDLIFVILYGGVVSILFGVALGLIDYYIQNFISLSFSMIFFFISAQYIGKTVRRQYEFPHIVYTIITAFFLAIQGLIILLFPAIYSLAIYYSDLTMMFSVNAWAYVGFYSIIQPLISTINFWLYLEIIILVVGTYVGTRLTY